MRKLWAFPFISAVYVAAFALQIGTGTDHRALALGSFLVVLGSWGLLGRLTPPGRNRSYWIISVFFICLALAVAFPPSTSKDVNSYAMYGRMVATYEASPYTHSPRDFAADEWYPRISLFWSDSPSVYGPVFTGISAGVMEVAGGSFLVARLGFQLLAAASLLLATMLAARRLGLSRAILLIGLNPLLLSFGVNDAHCDVLIGLCILATVLSLERRRFVLAGALLASAALVKIAAIPALAGAVVWTFFRFGKAASGKVLVSATVGVGGAFVLAGGSEALAPLRQAAGRHTRFSLWNPVHDVLTALTGTGLPTQSFADGAVSIAANVCVATVGLYLIWRHRNDVTSVVAVAGALVAYQLLGAYVLSWYAAWSLPALALVASSRTFLVAFAHGCWVAIAYFSGYGVLAVSALALFWLWRRRESGAPSFISVSDPWPHTRSSGN